MIHDIESDLENMTMVASLPSRRLLSAIIDHSAICEDTACSVPWCSFFTLMRLASISFLSVCPLWISLCPSLCISVCLCLLSRCVVSNLSFYCNKISIVSSFNCIVSNAIVLYQVSVVSYCIA